MDCFTNMEENKTPPRKRVANFTADEKALLAQLIKKRPIIESKQTDGKSIMKKKIAWSSVTDEFNSNAYVHKRDTVTLKRAWDNLKAMARKTRATERGNLIRTGGGPSDIPPHPPQQGAIISMVEEAAPVMICEVENSFDSDGTILVEIDNKENNDKIEKIEIDETESNFTTTQNSNIELSPEVNTDVIEICTTAPSKKLQYAEQTQRKLSDYIRREAVLRIKHFEAKKKIEMQILKSQLETEEIKKRAAEMDEERSRTLLEIAKAGLKKC